MTDTLRARLESLLGGAYALDRELVGGGMSRVFVGMETALGRRIVMKVLPPEVATREPVVRFRREAVLAAQLDHPHIVPVFVVGEVDGIRYYTMPFIDGESLRARLEGASAVGATEASRVLCEIASALACAHRHGIVHRDVKPENIFIDHGTGRALLSDFGVAWVLDGAEGLTQGGATVGTPAYMSPEQVDGRTVDVRSDIYSLGLVGWEMLSGVRPWAGETLYTVMHKQQYDVLPPIDAYRHDVPPSLSAALERALCKERTERWPSAEAFLMALAEGRGDASLVTSRTPHWDEEFGELGPLAEDRAPVADVDLPTLQVPARASAEPEDDWRTDDWRTDDWRTDDWPTDDVEGAPSTTGPLAPRDPEWAWEWDGRARGREPDGEGRRNTWRVSLGFAAVVVTAMAFGAVRLGRGLAPPYVETHGDIAPAGSAGVDASAVKIDGIGPTAAAARLFGRRPPKPVIDTALSLLHAPPPVRITARPIRPHAVRAHRHRRPHVRRRRRSAAASVAGRVATARLALEAYERIKK